MENLKKWLLPVLLALLGSIDMFLHLLDQVFIDAGLPLYYSSVTRVIAFLVTLIVANRAPEIKNVYTRKKRISHER